MCIRDRGSIEGELRAKRSKLLGPIDLIWNGYEGELNALAIEGQRHRGPVSLDRPGRRTLDSRAIDKIIPYFDLTLGLLLMLCLFYTSPCPRDRTSSRIPSSA